MTEETIKPKLKIYRGKHINVSFEPGMCCHLGDCLKNLPSVFNLKERPWINLNECDEADVIKAVNACPSGALKYFENNDDTVSVNIVRNGPLTFRGDIRVKPSFNAEVETQGRVSLCRCGLSKNMPYCDASHMKHFKDDGIVHKASLAETKQDATTELDIICVENGPLMCRGNVDMTDSSGETKTVIDPALCRCGASKRKPFCDGSHNKIDFKTANTTES